MMAKLKAKQPGFVIRPLSLLLHDNARAYIARETALQDFFRQQDLLSLETIRHPPPTAYCFCYLNDLLLGKKNDSQEAVHDAITQFTESMFPEFHRNDVSGLPI